MSLPHLRPGGADAAGAAGDDRSRVDIERVIFFSDAVFAIAITLLAIELRLPAGDYTDATLQQTLVDMVPEIMAFLLSFMVVALFWLGHYRLFRVVERVSPGLIRLNLVFLACVALVPFPTSVLAQEGNLGTAAITYAAFVLVTSLLSLALFAYAARAGLTARAVTERIRRDVTLRGLVVPVAFAVSMPVALVNPTLAEGLWFAGLAVQSIVARRLHLERPGG